MGPAERLWRFARRRYQGVRLHYVDIVGMGWMLALMPLLIVFGRGLSEFPFFLGVHIVYLVGGLELVRGAARDPGNRWLVAGRLLYPAVIFVYSFLEVGKLSHAIWPDPWFTDSLVAADLAVFGVHPTVWCKQFYSPWLDELMALFRVVYYVAPVAIFGYLASKGRQSDCLGGASIVVTTCVVNYIFFLLLPAISPRMIPEIASLNTTEYTGFLFGWIEHVIQGDQGAIVGNAFPSAHVAGTVAMMLVAYKYLARWAGHLMLFFSVGMAVSAVYLGFHHAMDPLAGLLLPLLCYPLVRLGVR